MLTGQDQINEAKGMTTVAEAAKLLDVSISRVHQFIADGRLKAKLLTPRLYVVDVADVRKLAAIPRKTGAAGHNKKNRKR